MNCAQIKLAMGAIGLQEDDVLLEQTRVEIHPVFATTGLFDDIRHDIVL